MAENLSPGQKAAVETDGSNMLVAAAAGSGKTFVLVSRLMRLICEENHNIDEFLIITFTRAAAAELRTRILKEINARLAKDPNPHLQRQQTLVYRAQINTIHGFCQSILHENAHLLGISPDFRIIEQGDADIMKADVLEKVLAERYEKLDERPAFRTLADTMGSGRDDSALGEIILKTHTAMLSHLDPEKWCDDCARQWDVENVSDLSQTDWGRYLMERERASLEYWTKQADELMTLIYGDTVATKVYAESMEETVAAMKNYLQALQGTWDEAFAKSDIPFPRTRGVRKDKETDTSAYVKDARERCKQALSKPRLCISTADMKEDIRPLTPVIRELFDTVLDFDSALSKEKLRRGVLDFNDLEHYALKLLLVPGTDEPTAAARAIQSRFTEIMVDEYQDVNNVQNEIFKAVSNGRNVFMVGDVKQSIYRFRLADPEIFLKKYRSFADCEKAGDGEDRRILLSENYRSREGVLDAVNFVFENIMSEDFGQMDYTDREALHCGDREKYSPKDEPCMELLVLNAPSDDNDKTVLEARMAARRVSELLSSGMTVGEKGQERPIRPSDIMLLLRSVKNTAEIYASALSELGIPAQTSKKTDFFSSVEITVMLSLLSVIDNPHQDVELISALRSPHFGFTPDELAAIRACCTDGDMFDALLEYAQTNEKAKKFTDWLARMRLMASDMTADELIWRVMLDTGAQAIFSAMPGGSERETNLMQLYEYARSFGANGRTGLFSFLHYIRRLIERKKEPEISRQSAADAVNIMSVHLSKGLEAPVVLLCSGAKQFNKETSKSPLVINSELGVGPWRKDLKRRIKYATLARMAVIEKEQEDDLAEEMRILYVAMTRAKEKLIVTCAYKNIAREMEKLCAGASLPVSPQALREGKCLFDWILSAALCREEAQCLRSIADAKISSVSLPYKWRIECLDPELDAEESEKPEEKPEPQADSALVSEISGRLQFVYPGRKAQSIPSKLTATGLKTSVPKEMETAEGAESFPLSEKRKTVFREPDFAPKHALTPTEKGTAAHLAMQYIDYAKCTNELGVTTEIARMEREHLLTSEQAQSINPNQILRLFRSPLGQRILKADRVRREFKFSLLRDASEYYPEGAGEKVLLQGVVDCCIEERGELTVIDYKTDFVGDEGAKAHAERYRPQLTAYAEAMEEICGQKVRSTAIYFLRTGETVEFK